MVHDHGGELPSTHRDLVSLPGVGPNTSGALLAYVYDQPVLYIETNIRTVYLHHFFADRRDVPDTQLLDKLTATLDHTQPRRFYWALMDYGAYLKRTGVKNIAASRHYRKQSPLAGSVREVRGQIVKALTTGQIGYDELRETLDLHDGRFDTAYTQLVRDGLIEQHDQTVRLTN